MMPPILQYIKQSIFEKQTSEISGTFYLLQITLPVYYDNKIRKRIVP